MNARMKWIARRAGVLLNLFVPSFVLAATTTAPTSDTGTFVPLTHLPQIESLSQAQGFATFVNSFYKILIGVGAVFAVLMIMVAGVQFMTSRGSVSSNEKAKSRIQNAILGLLLVLAPTIVFGIINPDILNLNLGTEFTKLQGRGVDQNAFQSNTVNPPAPGTCPANPHAINSGDMCPAGEQPTTQSCCPGISVTGVCCAPKNTSGSGTTAQPQGGQWGWKARFTGGGSTAGVYNQKGPFTTQQQCQASQTAFMQSNSNLTITEDQPCVCSQPMTQQPNCHL